MLKAHYHTITSHFQNRGPRFKPPLVRAQEPPLIEMGSSSRASIDVEDVYELGWNLEYGGRQAALQARVSKDSCSNHTGAYIY